MSCLPNSTLKGPDEKRRSKVAPAALKTPCKLKLGRKGVGEAGRSVGEGNLRGNERVEGTGEGEVCTGCGEEGW